MEKWRCIPCDDVYNYHMKEVEHEKNQLLQRKRFQ